MVKLSTLIFSRNDLDLALDLIKDVYELTDEIILIDCSDKKNLISFNKKIKITRLKKLRIYNAPALGYPDPLRSYGLNKCKYEWIIHLDTDERLSHELKLNIKNIISNANCSSFAIKRYENFNLIKNDKSYTWQVRLYKKNKTSFKGLIHELPKIKGHIEVLKDSKYFMNHMIREDNKKLEKYYLIEAFEQRLSYKGLIELCSNRGLPSFPLKIYYEIKSINEEDELSKKEYIIFLSVYLKAIQILQLFSIIFPNLHLGWQGNTVYRKGGFTKYDYYNEMIEFFFSFPENERNLQFNISKEIEKYGGVIKYLGLERDIVVRKISKERGGIKFFIFLLKERYFKGRNYYKNLSFTNKNQTTML